MPASRSCRSILSPEPAAGLPPPLLPSASLAQASLCPMALKAAFSVLLHSEKAGAGLRDCSEEAARVLSAYWLVSMTRSTRRAPSETTVRRRVAAARCLMALAGAVTSWVKPTYRHRSRGATSTVEHRAQHPVWEGLKVAAA